MSDPGEMPPRQPFYGDEVLRRLGSIEQTVGSVRDTVIETKTQVTALHNKVDDNESHLRELLGKTEEVLDNKIREVGTEVAVAHNRIDGLEERSRANFRLIITALVFPVVVLILGSIIVYALIGNTPA